MSKKTQYDLIADAYVHSMDIRDDRLKVLVPTAQYYLGDVRGKKVLDLACGSGFYTRFIKQWGAKEVVGVDISLEMIKFANDAEEKQKLGIKYLCGDVTALNLGEFDVIFAGFLLHYSSSVENLKQMCKAIAANLKKGGRFVSFGENPDHPLRQGRIHDAESIALEPIANGSRIKRIHYENGVKALEFTHYHYDRPTYEGAMTAAGFKNLQWQGFVLAENESRVLGRIS